MGQEAIPVLTDALAIGLVLDWFIKLIWRHCAGINQINCWLDMIRISLRYCLLATLLALLIACRATAHEELQSVSLVVTNGTVIDGTGVEPIADGFVAIQGDRIVAVGQSADFKIPDEATVIDAAGGTILPGVINSHVHTASTPATRRHLFLLDGVTSVCDLGIPLSLMEDLEQESSQSGLAARGFKAGPIVTAPGGYPGPYFGFSINYEVQGADQAEMAVRDLHARGADYIKVALEPGLEGANLPVITLQELRSIVASAHEYDLLVRTHVTKGTMLSIALKAGTDVLEHVPLPSDSFVDLESMFDEAGVFYLPPELEAQLRQVIDQGIVLVPTLDVMIGEKNQHGDIDPETNVLNQATLGVVRFFHESGGIIAVGNDYGNPSVHPGMPLREMELLQTAGLSPLKVIQAATQHAAYVCGQSEQLGTLERGKLADLIVVAGNPLDDLNALDSVLYIVKNGEIVVSPHQESK